MTDLFVSKEQREILTRFGESFDKLTNLFKRCEEALELVNSIAARTTSILEHAENFKTELMADTKEKIEKYSKRIKTLEDRNSYLAKKLKKEENPIDKTEYDRLLGCIKFDSETGKIGIPVGAPEDYEV